MGGRADGREGGWAGGREGERGEGGEREHENQTAVLANEAKDKIKEVG